MNAVCFLCAESLNSFQLDIPQGQDLKDAALRVNYLSWKDHHDACGSD